MVDVPRRRSPHRSTLNWRMKSTAASPTMPPSRCLHDAAGDHHLDLTDRRASGCATLMLLVMTMSPLWSQQGALLPTSVVVPILMNSEAIVGNQCAPPATARDRLLLVGWRSCAALVRRRSPPPTETMAPPWMRASIRLLAELVQVLAGWSAATPLEALRELIHHITRPDWRSHLQNRVLPLDQHAAISSLRGALPDPGAPACFRPAAMKMVHPLRPPQLAARDQRADVTAWNLRGCRWLRLFSRRQWFPQGRGSGGRDAGAAVLIAGGGVIGASIAYFLSCRGVKATVIEALASPAPPREVGRVSGARLVRRLAAGAVGAAQLCAACRVGGGDRRGLGLSPARHLWRLCRVPTPSQRV